MAAEAYEEAVVKERLAKEALQSLEQATGRHQMGRDGLEELQRLTSEKMEQYGLAIKAAQVAAEEEDSEASMRSFMTKITVMKEEFAHLNIKMKMVKRNQVVLAASIHEAERSALLSRSAQGRQNNGGDQEELENMRNNARRQMLENQSLVDMSRDITASLHRQRAMLAEQLERVSVAETTIAKDKSALANTTNQYDKYEDTSKRADSLVREIQKLQRGDWITIVVCFSIFLLTVIYIVWKRTIGWFI